MQTMSAYPAALPRHPAEYLPAAYTRAVETRHSVHAQQNLLHAGRQTLFAVPAQLHQTISLQTLRIDTAGHFHAHPPADD